MSEMNSPAALVGDREIAITRVFNAPRELVFKMWAELGHIEKWWGPRGFSTTTSTRDFKTGGVWRFVMHGPDGRDYQNRITFLEVAAPEVIVFKHGGDDDTEPVNHQARITFDDVGGKTRVNMTMTFVSEKAREFVVKTYGAVEGLTATFSRLEERLSREAGAKQFIVKREFKAPRDMVWKAWTEESRLKEWFGPKGFKMRVSKLDFRPGGTFHHCLVMPDGKDMWGKFVYREIAPPEKIVLVNSFSDEAGNITRHPFAADWPREMLMTTTFAERDGRTTITLEWLPLNATEAELKTFNATQEGMNSGWKGTFEQLDEYLARQ